MKKLSLLVLLVLCGFVLSAQESVKIYNPKANAQAELDAAVAKAKKNAKHVFVQVGGNWCVWCIRFHDLIAQDKNLSNYLNQHYEVVLVNYSPENKNEAVMKRLKNPGRFGFPVFVVLDGNGEVIHLQNSAYLESGNGHSPKLVLDFLKNWTYAAVNGN